MNTFESNILSIYQKNGKKWLKDLPEHVRYFENLWQLHDLSPLRDLSYSYVLSGFQAKQSIILKLSPDPALLKNEAAVLQAFAGYGAVSLLKHCDEALLLEQAMPGLPLNGGKVKNIKVACEVMKNLHRAPLPENHKFPRINECLVDLDKSWNIPQIHLENARRFKNELMKLDGPPVLLHADLHPGNILSHGDEWRVIDPKGMVGDPIHDTWAFIENLNYDFNYIADQLQRPFNDVVEWYYVHVVLAACWQVQDNLDPRHFLKLAERALEHVHGT